MEPKKNMGISINGGTQNGWFLLGKIPFINGMRTGGIPVVWKNRVYLAPVPAADFSAMLTIKKTRAIQKTVCQKQHDIFIVGSQQDRAKLLETTFPLLHILWVVPPSCFSGRKVCLYTSLAQNQLFARTCLALQCLSTCCCWATFSTAVFALQSSSYGCLLFLWWKGCCFRDYSMRQRFFQVA